MREAATLGANKLIRNEAAYHMFVLMAVKENDLITGPSLCAFYCFNKSREALMFVLSDEHIAFSLDTL